MRYVLLILSTLIVLAAVLSASAGGRAAFPGANGLIAFDSDRTGSEQIYTIAASGGPVTQLTTEGRNYAPAWSPDGARITFESDREGAGAVYVMNADGSGETRLAAGRLPAWTADGSAIGFIALTGPDDARHYGIFTVNASGGVPTVLIDSPQDDTMPAFSPDGTKIAYSSAAAGEGDLEIYVAGSDGSNPVPLTQNDTSDYYPAWSPDSSQIAWRCEDSSIEICVMNADGQDQHKLPAINPGNDRSPAWSPDGTRIAVETYTPPDRLGGVYTMNTDGSDPQVVTEQGDYEPDWQPLLSATSSPTTTPTPSAASTPTFDPVNPRQGDTDCDTDVDKDDGIYLLEYAAELEGGEQPAPCFDLQEVVAMSGFAWGDVNCDGAVNAIDALFVIAHTAGIELDSAASNCFAIGDVMT